MTPLTREDLIEAGVLKPGAAVDANGLTRLRRPPPIGLPLDDAGRRAVREPHVTFNGVENPEYVNG